MPFHPLAWLRGLAADTAIRVLDVEDLFRRSAERLNIASYGCAGKLGYFQGSVRDRAVLLGYARERTWAPEVQHVLEQVLRRGGTLIDVGANIGLTSIPIAVARAVRCYAFEPDPENYKFLLGNIAFNGAATVRPFNCAIMAEDGPLTFERSINNMGDHRVRRGPRAPGEFAEDRREVIHVQGRRLDSALATETLTPPVVLKVDTQGAEVQVLSGAAGLLERIDVAIFEFWPYGLRRMKDSTEDFYRLISAFPFGGILRDAPVEGMPTSALIEVLRRQIPSDGSLIDWADIVLSRRKLGG